MSRCRFGPEATTEAARAAEKRGFFVVAGDPNMLLLDLDTPAAYQQYKKMLSLIKEYFGLGSITEWPSQTPGCVHVVIRIGAKLTATERLLLQACCGSDLKREALGLVLHRRGTKEPSLLFRPGSEGGTWK